MRIAALRVGVLGGVLVPFAVLAQEGTIASPPNFAAQGIYSTKTETNQRPATYSTRDDVPTAPAQAAPSNTIAPAPWQQPMTNHLSQDEGAPFRPARGPQAPVAEAPRQVPAGNIPFGRASAEVFAPVPTGPRNVTAAPVEEVGIVTEDLAPAEPAPVMNLPPKDPTEPTPQTTPIFEAQSAVPYHHVTLRALNKVTGHATNLKGMTGEVMRFGNLEVIAKSCRKSAPTSQLDYATLLSVSELRPDEASKELFSGWMYASSPSLMALEHPVYDLTLVECATSRDTASKDKTKDADKKAKDATL